MGWKASMIIIQNPSKFTDEPALLRLLGRGDFVFDDDTTLEKCIFPGDESISIGYYNNCIIVCDDFQLMDQFLTDEVSGTGKRLMDAFPTSEILAVSCISTTNFHGYALLKGGRLLRAKAISSDDGFYVNMGKQFLEEEALYATATRVNVKAEWRIPDMQGHVFYEDQMMEAFTFGVAKRLLGVLLDHAEGEDLMDNVAFRRYVKG